MFPKLLYKFKAIESPPASWFKKLQSYCNHYIWSQGTHYLKAELMYYPIEEGGFQHLDIKVMDMAIKLFWLDVALRNPDLFWVKHLQSCLKMPLREFITCNISAAHLKYACKQPLSLIMNSVLKHWCKSTFYEN